MTSFNLIYYFLQIWWYILIGGRAPNIWILRRSVHGDSTLSPLCPVLCSSPRWPLLFLGHTCYSRWTNTITLVLMEVHTLFNLLRFPLKLLFPSRILKDMGYLGLPRILLAMTGPQTFFVFFWFLLMALSVWGNIDQVLCRMSLVWGLSDVLLFILWGFCVFKRKLTEEHCGLIILCQGCALWTWLLIVEADLNHMAKVVCVSNCSYSFQPALAFCCFWKEMTLAHLYVFSFLIFWTFPYFLSLQNDQGFCLLPVPAPRVSHFSKEHWFLFLKDILETKIWDKV